MRILTNNGCRSGGSQASRHRALDEIPDCRDLHGVHELRSAQVTPELGPGAALALKRVSNGEACVVARPATWLAAVVQDADPGADARRLGWWQQRSDQPSPDQE